MAASVTLRVVVAEDAALAGAIAKLRGEWAELSGGEMVVEEAAGDPLGEAFPQADLVVFPTRQLGQLCEAGYLRPVRAGILESEVLEFQDFFPVVRERIVVYGRRVMALPIGCVTPLLLYNDNGDSPPATWKEVPDRFKSLNSSWPNDPPNNLAIQFLAIASCYATHASRDAVLFDPRTIAPRIAEPPFLRAFERLREQYHRSSPKVDQPPLVATPADQATMLSPHRGLAAVDFRGCRVAPLPGAAEVYDPVAKAWQPRQSPQRTPVLGIEGRLVGVTSQSRKATSAFRLAAWLAGKQNSRQLATSSRSVANARLSLASAPDDWVSGPGGPLGRPFSTAQRESMTSPQALLTPRILGIDDYLTSLDQAIRQGLKDNLPPLKTLQNAAIKWETLTEAVGRDRQIRAYRRHLGMEQYEPERERRGR